MNWALIAPHNPIGDVRSAFFVLRAAQRLSQFWGLHRKASSSGLTENSSTLNAELRTLNAELIRRGISNERNEPTQFHQGSRLGHVVFERMRM